MAQSFLFLEKSRILMMDLNCPYLDTKLLTMLEKISFQLNQRQSIRFFLSEALVFHRTIGLSVKYLYVYNLAFTDLD